MRGGSYVKKAGYQPNIQDLFKMYKGGFLRQQKDILRK